MSSSRWILALAFCACLAGSATAHPSDDVVLFDGKIFTGEPAHPYAEAVAIRANKILAVGTRAEAFGAVSHDAVKVDLKGHFLMPGMIDSHCHLVGGGL